MAGATRTHCELREVCCGGTQHTSFAHLSDAASSPGCDAPRHCRFEFSAFLSTMPQAASRARYHPQAQGLAGELQGGPLLDLAAAQELPHPTLGSAAAPR